MSLWIDHIVIAVQDLTKAIEAYRSAGFVTEYGGKHRDGLTENALIIFQDGSYLELIARTSEKPDEKPLFAELLGDGSGYTGFALLADQLESAFASMLPNTVTLGEIVEGSRTRTDGTVLRWRMARLDGGMKPFIIQDTTPRHLRVPADADRIHHPNGAKGISVIQLNASDVTKSTRRYQAMLGGVLSFSNNARIEIHMGESDQITALKLTGLAKPIALNGALFLPA